MLVGLEPGGDPSIQPGERRRGVDRPIRRQRSQRHAAWLVGTDWSTGGPPVALRGRLESGGRTGVASDRGGVGFSPAPPESVASSAMRMRPTPVSRRLFREKDKSRHAFGLVCCRKFRSGSGAFERSPPWGTEPSTHHHGAGCCEAWKDCGLPLAQEVELGGEL